jgi:ATP-binding cassette, subfamily C (CFTR/MRP), member 1
MPFLAILFKIMYDQRVKGVKITDARVRLITEVLQGIRLIKFYGWEDFYVQKIQEMRTREVATLRKSAWVVCLFVNTTTLTPALVDGRCR